MALSRSMKQYMMGGPGGVPDPRRSSPKLPPAGGTFAQAQSQMRQQRQPLSARNRPKTQPPGQATSGTAADRARSAGLLTGGARGPLTQRPGPTSGKIAPPLKSAGPKPRPSAPSLPPMVGPKQMRPGAAGGMVSRAAGQAQNRFQAAGGKPQPADGAFGFLNRGRQRPAFRGGSRQYLR